MKTESTISKINKELISTFASLDAWFDKVCDEGFDHWSLHDVVQHVLTSNHQLLDLLSDGYDYAFAEFTDTIDRSDGAKSFDSMRFALREQLFHCLCLLDELDASVNDSGMKEMNVYDKLSSLTHHLQYHLERLEEFENVNS